MKTDPSSLRELYQAYAASRKTLNQKGCPSPSAMAESFEPSVSVRKKKKIIDHISACSYCREEFTMLLEFQNSAAAFQGIGETKSIRAPQRDTENLRKDRHRPFLPYAYALLGLSLTIVSLILLVHQKELSEVQRTGQRGITLLQPSSDQALSGPMVFRWKGRSESDYYVLELFDGSLLPIWTSDRIRDVKIRIPFDVYSTLHPGRPYYWMVTAFSRYSKTEESDLARFFVLR